MLLKYRVERKIENATKMRKRNREKLLFFQAHFTRGSTQGNNFICISDRFMETWYVCVLFHVFLQTPLINLLF